MSEAPISLQHFPLPEGMPWNQDDPDCDEEIAALVDSAERQDNQTLLDMLGGNVMLGEDHVQHNVLNDLLSLKRSDGSPCFNLCGGGHFNRFCTNPTSHQ